MRVLRVLPRNTALRRPVSGSRGRRVLPSLAAGLVCSTAAAALLPASCGNVPSFDGERAFSYLVAQCELGHRAPNSEGHERCRRYLVDFFRERTRNVSEQAFNRVDSRGDTLRLCNIIASFCPTKGARVLLGAHWDTRPRADRDPDPERRNLPIMGANDGASGVAVLMEIANAIVSRAPPVGVDIVLFDGEDYGEEGETEDYLLGSRHFASVMKGYQPRWGVVVDMVGDRDLQIVQEQVSLARAGVVVRMVWEEARRQGAGAFRPWTGDAVMDDHWPLLDMGVPCIDIIDFDYPYWHTHADTPERCAPASLEQVGRVLLGVIY